MASGIVYLLICAVGIMGVMCHGDDEGIISETSSSNGLETVNKDHIILLNVAAKGRVIELLANELARTEIIRALLVEYARECSKNVTTLEKACLSCMIDRCHNRVQECGLKLPPLREVVDHKTSPIKGLEFLSTPPTEVKEHMKNFVKIARSDILKDVPEDLMSESKQIIQDDLDQSLSDLNENLDTDTALHKLTLHVHGTKNVKATQTGNGFLVVISDFDHRTNLADVLSKKLKESRPLINKVKDRLPEVVDNMPAVVDQLNAQLEDFRQTIGSVFSNMLDNFQQNTDFPNTAVYSGNRQFAAPGGLRQTLRQRFRPVATFPQQPSMQRMQPPVQMNPGQFAGQMMTGQAQFNPGQSLIQANIPIQSPQMANGQLQQSIMPGNQGNPSLQLLQQQNALLAGAISQELMDGNTGQTNTQQQNNGQNTQWQGQNTQNQGFPSNMQAQQFQGQGQGRNFQGQSVMQAQNIQPQSFQGQAQMPTMQTQIQGGNFQQQSPTPSFQSNNIGGRRKRSDVTCSDLKQDPNKYCKTFESQCFNCTKEKSLRFEVCGEGVERARDEIKRLDKSVSMYLDTFEKHIVGNKLILKIELDNTERLHKSNSYEGAYITAKIGPSVLRFKSKLALNINNIRVSGSQIGDALWEKLWDEHVFKEAERVEIPPVENDIMGQTHDVNTDPSIKTAASKSGASTRYIEMFTFTLSLIGSVFVLFM